MPPDAPLTLDRVLAAAEDVIRRFGPSKATVVDVARALGVSHTAVHKHVGSKAGLRGMVVGRWVETTMPPLRAIVAEREPGRDEGACSGDGPGEPVDERPLEDPGRDLG